MLDGSGDQVLSQVLFFALVVFGFYVLAVRPQRARARVLAGVREQLPPGFGVMTVGGLEGQVVRVDGDLTTLEIAPGVPVVFATPAVVRVLDEPGPGTPP